MCSWINQLDHFSIIKITKSLLQIDESGLFFQLVWPLLKSIVFDQKRFSILIIRWK
jgi:hypothetical protein